MSAGPSALGEPQAGGLSARQAASDDPSDAKREDRAESADNEHQRPTRSLLARYARELAHHKDHFHLLLQSLDEAPTDKHSIECMDSFKGHVVSGIMCPYAHRVLSHFIVLIRPDGCRFIYDEVMQHGGQGVLELACHKYASRVILKILEYFEPWQVKALEDVLLANVPLLVQQKHASSLVRHFLMHGNVAQTLAAVKSLQSSVPRLTFNRYASVLVDLALCTCPDEDLRGKLAHAVLAKPGTVVLLAHDKWGHYLVCSMLQCVTESKAEDMQRQLMRNANSLKGSKYGLVVLAALELRGSVGGA